MLALVTSLQNREELEKVEAELRYKLENNLIDNPVTIEEMQGKPKQKPQKPTRRDNREQEKHMAWVKKVSEASGIDFYESTETKNNLTPEEMGEALL